MRRRLLVVGGLLLWGCEGTISGPRPDLSAPAPTQTPAITCEGEVVVGAEPMQRLTRVQYEQTVRDLLTGFVGQPRALSITTEAFTRATLLPSDPTPLDPRNRFRKLYTRYNRDVEQLHVDGWLQVATWVSTSLIPGDRDTLLGSCAAATAPAAIDACVRSFISRFGERALRHPLEADEVERYATMYGDTTQFDDAGLRDVIAVMLQAPDLIYLIESGTTPVAADVFALSDWEIASRLSYALWDSGPDEALRAAAARGELQTSEGRAAQLARMFADPHAREVIERFADDWLRLSDVPNFAAKLGQPQFDTFAGAAPPTTALSVAARQELRAMVVQLAFAPTGHVTELLTSPSVFPSTDELAHLYGLGAAWNGEGTPPTAVDTTRPGLLTRVGLVGSGLAITRPVLKGAFIFDQLLCEDLGTPPPGAASQKITLSGPYTTRHYIEALTQQPGTSCQGCHQSRLNGLGFATEMFDGLGRFREKERFIDETGAVLAELPVDTSSSVSLAGGQQVANADDLARVLTTDGRFEACVARQLFRYSFSRPETPADACTLVPMWTAARQGSLREVWTALTDSAAFTQRRIEVTP